MAAHEPDHPEDSPEGGPVKTFLEHLEDFRWVLIKSLVALSVAMLLCLFAANNVVQIIKWPLKHAPIHFSGTNQIAVVSFGTNHLGNFQPRHEPFRRRHHRTAHARHKPGSRLARE
jgi:sec-independent protein translocase protein TatC